MISDHDRSGWFGASDTDKIVGNWATKTWRAWWMQKIGINSDHFDNVYTIAGTNWEHRILDFLDLPDLEMDKQILIPDLHLRVNLDGNTPMCIKEVKTYKWEKGFKVPKKYWMQVQVQLYASQIPSADIVAYGLTDEDYKNFFRPIDPERLTVYPIPYDPKWIEDKYLPKLRILAECLEKGVMPDAAQFR